MPDEMQDLIAALVIFVASVWALLSERCNALVPSKTLKEATPRFPFTDTLSYTVYISTVSSFTQIEYLRILSQTYDDHRKLILFSVTVS